MDAIDQRILELLQEDGRLARAVVAERVGLSTAAAHERIRKLERSGVIRRYAALVDAEKVGCDLLVFVQVVIEHPKHETLFLEAIARMSEVQECHRVTGAATCLLKVRVPDRRALQRSVLDRINAMDGVRDTETVVVLSTAKESPRIHLVPRAEP